MRIKQEANTLKNQGGFSMKKQGGPASKTKIYGLELFQTHKANAPADVADTVSI